MTDMYVPLAARMRPRNLDEFVGQEEIVGKQTSLRQAIEKGEIGSLLLWGPPGAGKTTLAHLIAAQLDAAVERVSAVTAGVKDLREVIGRAQEWRKIKKRTVLIVDEIHRFNKAQQDVLLPVVEEGLVTLIGATTENPYFEVVAALVSRAQVVQLKGHADEDIIKILEQALSDSERGVQVKMLKGTKEAVAKLSNGDGRRALNILEQVAQRAKRNGVTIKMVEEAAHKAVIQYDKAGDAHYDTISAFIKSMRGSDPDAALFYLFRMVLAGEDPKFIVRRMMIFASEDIGNADPHALMVAVSTAQVIERVGMPEGEFALAHAATYLAAAPKSNSVYIAKERAKEDVRLHGNDVPPGNVVNAPVAALKSHGKGVGYKYPHDFVGHIVQQEYRPRAIQNNIYYEPGSDGFEKEVKRRVDEARKILRGK